MAKADFTRDYYGDLELPPTADVAEIKKQFKKLALAYHPDRNPGRENEVTAQFQRIQSAHEVLIDTQERAKYDANRQRAANAFRTSYSGGTASGMRGNPWSNVSSQFPTPPKAPTARSRPSAGAQRYTNNFKPPSQSPYEAAQNGRDSRQDTFNAFERMRHGNKAEPGPGKTWSAPQPPPRGTPQSGREESNARAQAEARARANARPAPGFDEYREPNTSHRRSQSSNAPNRKGFMPNTPGGDEPPAPKGAYFTKRDKPTAPPPPPRQPPSASSTANVNPDPLRHFRDKEMPSMQSRPSQPYTTHGGEKFSLFDNPNISRSKSTREGNRRSDDGQVPRTGSDSNLNSPFRERAAATPKPAFQYARVDSSSSDDLPEMNGSASGPSETKSNGSAPRSAQQAPDTRERTEPTTHGPPLRSGQANMNGMNGTTPINGQPSIFTFPINDGTFNPTQPRPNGFSKSTENISTKFTPEDWDGKFAAGAEYFKPAAGVPSTQPRAHSSSRSRGRSPPKVRPTVDPKFMPPPTAELEIPMESPGGTKFSADEWKETFKPATFMPPANTIVPPRPQSARKRTLPNLRPAMGGRATVVDESDEAVEQPLFAERKGSSPQASVPDPMDVDTPPTTRTVPQFVPLQANEKLNVHFDPLKQPASSTSQSPTDEADLKVSFADLNLEHFMSSLNMPSPMAPPMLPDLSESERPTREVFENYIDKFAAYMSSWDMVYTKFLLHMASRKTQNLDWKDKRWTNEKDMDAYRLTLKEDRAVLTRWHELYEKHEKAIKECAIVRERMKLAEQEKGGHPRKKTH